MPLSLCRYQGRNGGPFNDYDDEEEEDEGGNPMFQLSEEFKAVLKGML